jgi:hypothetical protein
LYFVYKLNVTKLIGIAAKFIVEGEERRRKKKRFIKKLKTECKLAIYLNDKVALADAILFTHISK